MEAGEISIGKVITFYSYKGGVGRSMAMANIAVVLAKWGKKVLIVDWDLEAPGLEYFFYDRVKDQQILEQIRNKKGVIDILMGRVEHDYEAKQLKWDEYEVDLCAKIGLSNNGKLTLITSGQKGKDNNYIDSVRKFNYSTFYDSKDGGIFLEEIRNKWIYNNYDFVLIDSRTGLTESGGVCTIHMPDVLLLLFTPNEQSLKGVIDVATRSMKKHENLPFDRYGLFQLFVPTRFDDLESTQQEEWLATIDKAVTPLIDWLPYSQDTKSYTVTMMELIGQMKIPYKAKYAYGERLAVAEEQISEPGSISYTYKTIAAVIANNFASISDLKGNRDIFVQRAMGEKIKGEDELRLKVASEVEEKDRLKEQLRKAEEEKEKMRTIELEKERVRKKSRIKIFAIVGILFAAIFTIAYFSQPKDTPLTENDLQELLLNLFKNSFKDSTHLAIKSKNSISDILNTYNNYYKLNAKNMASVAIYKRTMDSSMQPILQNAVSRLYSFMPNANYALDALADTMEQFGSDRNIPAKDIFTNRDYRTYLANQREKIDIATSPPYSVDLITLNSFTSDSTFFTVKYVENVYTLFPDGDYHIKDIKAVRSNPLSKALSEISLNYDLIINRAVPGNSIKLLDNSRVFLVWGNKNEDFSQYQTDLKASGFQVMGAKFLNDMGRPDRQEIRYFNLPDSTQANLISRYMSIKTGTAYPAIKYTDSTAKPGYIEIWFGR